MKSNGLSELGRRTSPPPIAWLMKMTLERPKLISLAAGFTDSVSLPVTEARELLDSILSRPKTARETLQYGSSAGDPLLRRLTSERLRRMDRAAKSEENYLPDRVLVTHGSQQLLYLATEALCDPGDIVLVEDPTYFVYLSILQSHGVCCRGVRTESDGIDLKALDSVLRALQRQGDLPRVKLLYLVSYFQNPSGATTRFEKKEAALNLLRSYERAAGHPLYLIEDAAYRELRFSGEDVPSALSAGKLADRLIYAGTYSKPFATGVRVGFGVFPDPLRTVVSRIQGNHDFGTSNLLQQLLARALESGLYDRHLPSLQARYGRKAAILVKALREHFPESARWDVPDGGMYVWALMPNSVRTGVQSKTFQKALQQDVLYVPGELCYAEDATRTVPKHAMRLSFGGAKEADIREGIRRLGRVVSAKA